MTPHERRDETAGRHDLEAALTRIVERGPHQARTDALAFVGRRHLGVREDRAIALLAIDGHGETMLGVELVAALGCVVSPCHVRSTSQHIGEADWISPLRSLR